MDKQLTNVLVNLGLNEKEARVFLACTQLGTSVVSEIAHSAGINRVTTYDILEKLKHRGVALPKFKTLTGEINHPRVRYFEGLEGIKAIYADSLTSKTEILNYSNSAEIRVNWPTYDQDYVEKRAKKGIYLRGICPKDKAGETIHSQDKKYHREMRLVPSAQFDFTNEINIYDDKVAIISFKDELIGMILESIEIANSQRAIFNMSWQFAESLEKNPNNMSLF